MGSYDVFIRRPILTLMITLSLIVFGVLGYQRLGVDQFPDMDFPIVTVSSQLEGASPEVIEQDVTDVLEEHLNTIAGVRQLRSKSYHGTSIITVERLSTRKTQSTSSPPTLIQLSTGTLKTGSPM